MTGTKHISDLITTPDALKPGRINIIEAPVSSGKTTFALRMLPDWAGSPEKILYLIDTTNGELHLQYNTITDTIGRPMYAFSRYNTKNTWGEYPAEHKMPVMTYAGFGSEVLKNDSHFKWTEYEFIICDEMQNLVNYQNFKGNRAYLMAAENVLRKIVQEGKTKIVALSATTNKIYEHFGELCYAVPFDGGDLRRLETFHSIPYAGKVEEILNGIAADPQSRTGILYTTTIEDILYPGILHLNFRGNQFEKVYIEKVKNGIRKRDVNPPVVELKLRASHSASTQQRPRRGNFLKRGKMGLVFSAQLHASRSAVQKNK